MVARTLIALSLLALPTALAADTVRLKNGATIHGTVLEGEAAGDAVPDTLAIRIAGAGVIRIPSAGVEGWDRDDTGAGAPTPAAPPAPPAPAAKPAPAAEGETIATTHIARLASGKEVRGDLIEGESPDLVTLRIGDLGVVAFPKTHVIEVVAEAGSVTLPAPPRERPAEEPAPPPPAPTLEEIVAEIAADVVDQLYADGWRGAALAVDLEDEAILAEAASELTRQRNTNRNRAEDTLRDYGAAALPYIRPLTNHPFSLTRTAVQRLVRDAGAWEGGPLAIAGLADPDPFVSGTAEEAIAVILGPEVDEDLTGIGPDEAWELLLDVEARRLAAILAETLEEFLAEEEPAAPESTASASN